MKYQTKRFRRQAAVSLGSYAAEQDIRKSESGLAFQLQPINQLAMQGLKVVKADRFATSSEEQSRWIHELHVAKVAISEAMRPPTRFIDPRRFTGPYPSREFDGLIISFEGMAKYDWGELLDRVNSDPFQRYFNSQLSNQTTARVGIQGWPPNAAGWGYVRMSVTSMSFCDRFGGSIHLQLLPLESFGIELADPAKNLYLDLHQWILHLYLQPTKELFNNPSLAFQNVARHMFVELEIKESEAYLAEIGSGLSRYVPHPTVTEAELNALITSAANKAAALLQPLGTYVLGLIHEKLLGDFDARACKVVQIFIGQNASLCHFDTLEKTPYVEVLLEVCYLGTRLLDKPFDRNPEVTAEPSSAVLSSDTCLLAKEFSKYIGGGSSTGWLSLGFLTLEEASRARIARVLPLFTESDPILDDLNFPPFFEWNLNFRLSDLEALAASNAMGQIGPLYQDTQADSQLDGLSYEVTLAFRLVMF